LMFGGEKMRESTEEEKEMALHIVQKGTGKKMPRRYLLKMLDLICLYFVGYENRSKNWVKQQIDDYFA